jgi:hypothetical protein
MPFTTYWNRQNPHVSIHLSSCGQLRKRGGEHADGDEHYREHANLEDAKAYATSLSLEIRETCHCRKSTHC